MKTFLKSVYSYHNYVLVKSWKLIDLILFNFVEKGKNT